MGNARYTAVKLLMRTFRDGGYSHLLLDKELAASDLSKDDKRLCALLYYGVTERLLTLEHVVQTYSGKPLAKLDDEVRCILCLGIYQLKYCDTIPARAAVNETVKLCSMLRKRSAAGFVNAVLRHFQRDGLEIRYPDTPDDDAVQQIRWSAPAALIAKVRAEQGTVFAEQFFEDSLRTPPVTIRLNTCRAVPADIAALHPVESTRLADAYFTDAGNVAGRPEFRNGLYHVQDLSSQLCCAVLAPQPGETVLDVCAAPGGKSFTIAERMQNRGTVYAFDLHTHRVKLIRDGAERLGLTCIQTAVQDAAVHRPDMPAADRILCDVPCSGLGVIRRKPEIKYKPLDSFADLPALQYRILETAGTYLKPGGVLVYSTCTISKDENERVVERFLAAHPEFVTDPLTEFGFSEGWATFSPAFDNCDGFFAARLRREA